MEEKVVFVEWMNSVKKEIEDKKVTSKNLKLYKGYISQFLKNPDKRSISESDAALFLNEFCPNITNTILNKNATVAEAQDLNQFLSPIVSLFIVFFNNDDFRVMDCIYQIITQAKCNFYLSTAPHSYSGQRLVSSFYVTNIEALFNSKAIPFLVSFYSQPNQIPLSKFVLSVNLVFKNKYYIGHFQLQDYYESLSRRCIFIINNIDDATIKQLQEKEFFSLLTSLITCAKPETKKELLMAKFNYSIALANSKYLQKRYEGFVSIKDMLSSYDSKQYAVLLDSKGFLNYALVDLHHQLVPEFSSILKYMASHGLCSIKIFEDFWDLSTNQHSSSIEVYFKGWSTIFMNLSVDLLRGFWNFIPKKESFPIPAIKFLSSFSHTAQTNEKIELFNALSSYYQNNGLDKEYKRQLTKLICLIIPDNEKVCDDLQDHCFDSIKYKKDIEFSLAIFKASSKRVSSDKAQQSFSAILETIKELESENSAQYLTLIAQLLQKMKRMITKDEFESLVTIMKSLLLTNVYEVFEFFQAIKLSWEKKFEFEMMSRLYQQICQQYQLNDQFDNLVILLFKFINKKCFDDFNSKISIQDTKTLIGIDELWEIGLSKSNVISGFICSIYSNTKTISNYSEFIDKCLADVSLEFSIASILSIIKIIENSVNKSIMGIDSNSFYLPNEIATIKLCGMTLMDLVLPLKMPFKTFKWTISYILQKPSDKLIIYHNKDIVTEKEFVIGDGICYEIKESLYYQGNSAFKIPDPSIFPSLILFNHPSFGKLFNYIDSTEAEPKNSSIILELLNYLPTRNIENDILNRSVIDEEVCNDFFNNAKPFLSFYRLNSMGKYLTNFLIPKMPVGCFVSLVNFALYKAKDMYEFSSQCILSLLKLLNYGFTKLGSEDLEKMAVIEIGQDSFDKLVQWILSFLVDNIKRKDMEMLVLLLGFLDNITKVHSVYFQNCKEITDLITKGIFYQKKTVRSLLYNSLNRVDTIAYCDKLTSLITIANNDYCDFYFLLFSKVIKETPQPDLVYRSIRDSVFLFYIPSRSDSNSILSQLTFIPPPDAFTQGIFSSLGLLIKRTEFKFDDDSMFNFLIDNILFNPFKYFHPTQAFFDILMHFIELSPGLVSVVQPKLETILTFSNVSNKLSSKDVVSSNVQRRGLFNLGATCYLNSSLQQLFNIEEFRSILLREFFEQPLWLNSFQNLIADLLFLPTNAVDPSLFISTFRWYGDAINPREQQDAVEFIQMLLDQIGQNIPDIPKLFTGKIIHQIVGTNVSYSGETYEDFVTFSLEVKDMQNLEQSLQTFMLPDDFSGSEQYNADGIGKIDAKAYHRILKAPQILIVQLKRFLYNMKTGQREKINSKFSFPQSFDLSNAMRDQTQPLYYDLIGVTMHMGSANGGHYYTYAKSDSKQWYTFNDSSVRKFNPEKLEEVAMGGSYIQNNFYYNNTIESNSSAYLLFYRQRSEINEDFIPLNMNIDILSNLSGRVKSLILKQVLKNDLYTKFVLSIASKSNDYSLTHKCLLQTLNASKEKVSQISIISALKENCLKDPSLYQSVLEQKSLGIYLLHAESDIRRAFADIVIDGIGIIGDYTSYFNFINTSVANIKTTFVAFSELLIPLSHLINTKKISDIDIWIGVLINILEYASTTLATSFESKKFEMKYVFITLKTAFESQNTFLCSAYPQFLTIPIINVFSESFIDCFDCISLFSTIVSKKECYNTFCKVIFNVDKMKPSFLLFIYIVSLTIRKYHGDELLRWVMCLDQKSMNYSYSGFLKLLSEYKPASDSTFHEFFVNDSDLWINNWLLSKNQEVQNQVKSIFYSQFPKMNGKNSILPDDQEFIEVQQIVKDLLKKMKTVFDIVNSSLDDFTSVRSTPLDVYLSILKWSLTKTNSQSLIIPCSVIIVKFFSIISGSFYCSTLEIIVKFMEGLLNNDQLDEFFQKASYSSFISSFKSIRIDSNNEAPFALLVNMTPISKSQYFLKSDLFAKGVENMLCPFVGCSKRFYDFLTQLLVQENKKIIVKTIFDIKTFRSHFSSNSVLYFDLCYTTLSKYCDEYEKLYSNQIPQFILNVLSRDIKNNDVKIKEYSDKLIKILSKYLQCVNSEAKNTKKPEKILNEFIVSLGKYNSLYSDMIKLIFHETVPNIVKESVWNLIETFIDLGGEYLNIISPIIRSNVINQSPSSLWNQIIGIIYQYCTKVFNTDKTTQERILCWLIEEIVPMSNISGSDVALSSLIFMVYTLIQSSDSFDPILIYTKIKEMLRFVILENSSSSMYSRSSMKLIIHLYRSETLDIEPYMNKYFNNLQAFINEFVSGNDEHVIYIKTIIEFLILSQYPLTDKHSLITQFLESISTCNHQNAAEILKMVQNLM